MLTGETMKMRFSRKPQALILGIALTGGVAGYAVARTTTSASAGHVHASLKLADPSEGPSKIGFAPIVKEVLPSVVNISSSKVVRTPNQFAQGLPDDPMFRQFFGRQFGRGPEVPKQRREQSLGAGVIVSPEGYILPTHPGVSAATDVKVTLSDRRELKAKIIGTDPKTDVAVLKLEGSNFPAITLGDSSKVQVGDYALAIGDPFGVGQTVTMGIVSAKGRGNLGIEDYEDFIQTDAPINPGNSGGALINDRGELVGINTAILSHGSGGNEGIGFAIPINMARSVMSQILDHGKVTRAYLGIMPQDVTPDIAKQFGEKEARGALVADVSAGSPAQKSGLERGDIILDVNGKPVADSNELRMTISMMAPDSDAKLKVLRNGSEREIAVKLDAMPTEQASKSEDKSDGSANSALSGVSVDNLDAQSASDLGLSPNTKGVVVTNVDPSSEAAEAGLRRGDVIQEVNRQPVKNTSDFERAMRSSKDKPLLLVNRNGSTMYLTA